MENGSVEKAIHSYFEARKSELMATRQARASELHQTKETIGDLSQRALSLEAALVRIDGALVNLESMKSGVAKSVADAISE